MSAVSASTLPAGDVQAIVVCVRLASAGSVVGQTRADANATHDAHDTACHTAQERIMRWIATNKMVFVMSTGVPADVAASRGDGKGFSLPCTVQPRQQV
jgi:hypothetical protein